jgi:hypothetical protein
MVSSEAYTGIDSRRSTWENEPYFASEFDRSRSEVAEHDHRGGQSTRSSMMSDPPSPPLPSLQSENPFNTEPDVNISGMDNISEELSSLENSDEVTGEISTKHGGGDRSTPVVCSVTGVARATSTKTVYYLGRSLSKGFGPRLPASQNPFNDGPSSRFSAADSIDETVDTHQIHGMINTFPTPPDPIHRTL